MIKITKEEAIKQGLTLFETSDTLEIQEQFIKIGLNLQIHETYLMLEEFTDENYQVVDKNNKNISEMYKIIDFKRVQNFINK